MRELYDVSPELVSKVTDAVHDEIREWQARPLDDVYAIVYFDAVRAKVRDDGLVRNKAVYLGIGVTCTGRKEVLGLWIEQTERARFWFAVLSMLKARGLIANVNAVHAWTAEGVSGGGGADLHRAPDPALAGVRASARRRRGRSASRWHRR